MKHYNSWLVHARNVFPFLILFGILVFGIGIVEMAGKSWKYGGG